MNIEQTTDATVSELWATVAPLIQQGTSLEEAAQSLATAVHTQFSESAVLARVYVTVPFDELPPHNRTFVETLVASTDRAPTLEETTPVLSLVGTHGQETTWNDRRNSRRHKGIPLMSAAFVEEIPMIARMTHK